MERSTESSMERIAERSVERSAQFEVYFELLYPLWVVDSLRTLKVHHCLPLVTIGCP